MTDKRQAIINAASRIFLKEGFSGASINEIARRAGVSKRTLYKHFDSKTVLFGAIISHTSEKVRSTLQAAGAHDDPRVTLTDFARSYLDLVLSPLGLDLSRTMIAESKRFPQLGRTFYATGTEPTNEALCRFLARQHAAGTLSVPEPEILADQFFGLCLGSLRRRAYFNPSVARDKAMIERWIDSAVGLFLRGCGYRSSVVECEPASLRAAINPRHRA